MLEGLPATAAVTSCLSPIMQPTFRTQNATCSYGLE